MLGIESIQSMPRAAWRRTTVATFLFSPTAPVGQAPTIRQYLNNDHVSIINGITPDDKLYMSLVLHSLRMVASRASSCCVSSTAKE